VTIEQNVYFDKLCLLACRLEGEDWEFVEMKTDTLKTDTFSTSKTPTPTQPTIPPAVPSSTASRAPSPTPSDHDNSPKEEFLLMKHIRKPSQCVHDILEGCGATSAHPSDPVITTSV
jgi:hypothetical protein